MNLVDSARLKLWAASYAAKADLPALLRRLITCSVSVTQIRFPDGQGIWLPGADGFVESSVAHPYVPAGTSMWELGTQANVKAKAEEDYAKRSTMMGRQETEFIFVTPQVWTEKEQWAQEKTDLGVWKRVRAYDAHDLVAWMQECPAVQLWFLHTIKELTQHAFLDPETAWREWSKLSNPELGAELVLAGRTAEAGQLLSRLGSNDITLVCGSSPAESYGFALAAMRSVAVERDRTDLLSRVIVVKNQAALMDLGQTANHIILLHSATSPVSLGSVGPGCHIIIPYGSAPDSGRDPIVLPRPTRRQFTDGLKAMRVPEDELETMANASGFSVTVYQRRYASAQRVRPAWAPLGASKPVLHVAMLVGTWNRDHPADRDFLRTLSGCATYEEFENALYDLCTGDDPPAYRAGSRWRMTSPVDCFGLLAVDVSTILLDAYHPLAIQALSFADPNLTFGGEQSLMTQPVPGCSQWLREGIVEMLLIIGEFGDRNRLRKSARDYVDTIVGGIPGIRDNWTVYGSLSPYLARLAEAAPRPFLASLEHLLEVHREGEPHLFVSQNTFWGRHYHTGILWALETLAQSPVHFEQACRLLAKCATLDRGITIQNRPINSLTGILLWWYPGTAAVAEKRLAALREMAVTFPEVAWTVCANVMPNGGHRATTLPPRAKWATFPDPPDTDRTRHALYLYALGVVDIAVGLCGTSANRWMTILRCCPQIEPSRRIQYYEAARLAARKMAPQERGALYNDLREFVAGHRKHKTANWALPEDQLQPLDELVQEITPTDSVGRWLWLFQGWHPKVGEQTASVEDMEKAIEQARDKAINEIIEQSGSHGVKDLIERAKYPAFIAVTLNRTGRIDLLCELMSEPSLPRPFTFQASVALYKHDPDRWKTEAHNLSERVTAALMATILCGAPCEEATWSLAQNFGPSVWHEYWQQVMHFPRGDTAHWEALSRHLIAANRADTLIELIALYKPTVSQETLLLAADGLIGLLGKAEKKPHCESYDVSSFLSLLRTQHSNRLEVAKREYALLPVMDLDGPDTESLLLHQLIAEDPELYVSILGDMYLPESTSHEDKATARASVGEIARARGEIGYKILQSMTVLPGTKADGNIDEETLGRWIEKVRVLAKGRDRVSVTDIHLGHLLAHAPVDPTTQRWPHRSIQAIVQRLANEDVESGIMTERYNMRGVISRNPESGGALERSLAEEYRQNARVLLPNSTRMRVVLEKMAESWERDARSEDKESLEEGLGL